MEKMSSKKHLIEFTFFLDAYLFILNRIVLLVDGSLVDIYITMTVVQRSRKYVNKTNRVSDRFFIIKAEVNTVS